MNPENRIRQIPPTSDKVLKDWKAKVPLNRAGRRNQLSRYKYYLEVVETDGSWSVFGVMKDKKKFLIDDSENHKPKEPKVVTASKYGIIGDDEEYDDEDMIIVEEETNEESV